MTRLTPLASLLALYIGSEFAAVGSQEFVGCGITCETHSRAPVYRIDSHIIRAAFAPALWLDQHLRPRHWNWTVDLEIGTTEGLGRSAALSKTLQIRR